MADTYKVLFQGQLGTGAAGTIYTPGVGKMGIIKNMMIKNVGANTETVTFFLNGTSTAAQFGENLILSPTGSDGSSAEWDGTLALANGDILRANSTDATAVTLLVTGDEIS